MNNTNKTPHSCERGVLFGWGSRIRTYECQSQSLVPYRLAIPHSLFVFNIPIIPQASRGVKMFSPLFAYIFRAARPLPRPVSQEPLHSPPRQSKSRPAFSCGAACLLGYRQLPAITSVRPVQQRGVRSAHGRESRKRNPGRSGGRTLRTWGRRHARRRYRRAGSCLRDGQE